jgi:protein phosphatase
VAIHSVGRTDRGRRRPLNEDALLCDDALGLYVVADGVGGHAKGEVASSEAVDQIHGFVRQGRAIIDRFAAEPEADEP